MSPVPGSTQAGETGAGSSPSGVLTEPKRTYAKAAASESLEDQSLRYAPPSFRTWSMYAVASTAIGGIAYLADFAIGASIVLTNGAASGISAILAAAIIIFVTGVPIARACAKYGVESDLPSTGFGYFGYFGSTLTSLHSTDVLS